MQRFGLKGVTLDNLEQVYNPLVSGFANMAETRAFLIKRGGMTSQLADNLAKRYINKVEQEGTVFSVMDLFNGDAKSLDLLVRSPIGQVQFGYQTWNEYTQEVSHRQHEGVLHQRGVASGLSGYRSAQPVRPNAQRGFSTSNTDKEGAAAAEGGKYSEKYLKWQEDT